MGRYFIDLGAFTGDTLATAKRWYPGFDRYFGFEPLPEHFLKLREAYDGDPTIELVAAAADVRDGEATLYRGNSQGQSGGSLCQKDNCLTVGALTVQTRRLSSFLLERFSPADYVVLKLDIEGKEYEVFEDLMTTGALARVDVLFCEWHYDRIGVSKLEHDGLVERLNDYGFGLTGNNSLDEFHFVAKDWEKLGRWRYSFTRGWPKTKLRLRYRFPRLWNAVRTLRGKPSTA
jgi:FkbM family methyltransferase